MEEVKEEQKAPAINLFKFFRAKESNKTSNEGDAQQSFLLQNRPFCEPTEAQKRQNSFKSMEWDDSKSL